MSKRVEQKAAARVVREQLAKEQRRKRSIWISVTAVCALTIAGLVGWGIYSSNKGREVHIPAAANSGGNAIVTGSGPVIVEDYVDFICPHCKTFHDESGPVIYQLVAENKITLVQHPVAYLDRFSTNRYSTRASAAAACSSDGGRFTEFVATLFANQPGEGGPGPTNDQLIALGRQVGLGEPFAQCVKDGRYITWAGKVSDEATKAGVTSTPTVLVNGVKIEGKPAAIMAAVEKASGPAPLPTSS